MGFVAPTPPNVVQENMTVNEQQPKEEVEKELSPKQKERLEQQKLRMEKKNEKRREKALAKERKDAEHERKRMERERKAEELRLEKESLPPKKLLEVQRLAEERELFEKEFLATERPAIVDHKKKSILVSGRLGGSHMA